MIKLRLATAAVGIPLILGAVYLGGYVLTFAIAALCLIATEELRRVMNLPNGGARWFMWLWAVSICLVTAVRPGWRIHALALFALLYLTVKTASLVTARDRGDLDRAVREVLATLLSLFYPTFFLSYLLLMREEQGYLVTWLVLLGVWANDTAAYFYGKARGRTPLAPFISPGKTVSGAVAGLAAGLVVTGLFGVQMAELPLAVSLLAGLLIPVMAQVGDLFESLLKRVGGHKDSGRMLPGHGGVLDRFDSLAFVVPAMYYFLVCTQGALAVYLQKGFVP